MCGSILNCKYRKILDLVECGIVLPLETTFKSHSMHCWSWKQDCALDVHVILDQRRINT